MALLRITARSIITKYTRQRMIANVKERSFHSSSIKKLLWHFHRVDTEPVFEKSYRFESCRCYVGRQTHFPSRNPSSLLSIEGELWSFASASWHKDRCTIRKRNLLRRCEYVSRDEKWRNVSRLMDFRSSWGKEAFLEWCQDTNPWTMNVILSREILGPFCDATFHFIAKKKKKKKKKM